MFDRSGYKAGFYPSMDPQGHDRLLIVVKRTFDIDVIEGKCRPADAQDDIVLGDEFHGDTDPFKSSVRYESDLAPWKVKRDVLVLGKAYAPKGNKAPTWDVAVQIGRFKRSLRIFGPRKVTWVPPKEVKKRTEGDDGKQGKKAVQLEYQPPIIGEPEPIDQVDLTYENAYGGICTYYPEEPAAFRKAIRQVKKKKKKKEQEQEAAAKAAADAQSEADQKKAAAEAEKARERELKSYFFHGVKDIKHAPDEELEVEIGSRKLKSRDGTIVLDLAELAEVEEREAQEAKAARAAAKQAGAAEAERDDGALKATEDELAAMAAELTDEALSEQGAYQAARRAESAEESGTRVIDLAEMGDEIVSDDDWVDEQKQERERFYESLGLDPDVEVVWEEGEFPRVPCPTNFVGKGFALRNCKESLDGLDMPLIEDPERPLKPEDLPIDPRTLHLPTVPEPAGFGPLSRGWTPRALLAGYTPKEIGEAKHKMDKQLVEELDPDDEDDQATIKALMDREPPALDPRFYNAAPASLQVDSLYGDEDVFLEHLDPKGKTFFKLPASRPLVRFDRGEGWERVDVQLDTLVIDREAEKVWLVWRGHRPLGSVDEMATWKRVDIDVQDMGLAEWREREQAEELERRRRAGEALKLGVDEIDEAEAAEFDRRIEQAGIGLHGIKEERVTDAREVRDEHGVLIDIQDREDVIMSGDEWIEQAQLDMMSDDEKKKRAMARDERLAVQEKKKALKARMEEIERKKQEAAEAEAKKKKKKKQPEKPPADDDEDDEDADAADAPKADDKG